MAYGGWTMVYWALPEGDPWHTADGLWCTGHCLKETHGIQQMDSGVLGFAHALSTQITRKRKNENMVM